MWVDCSDDHRHRPIVDPPTIRGKPGASSSLGLVKAAIPSNVRVRRVQGAGLRGGWSEHRDGSASGIDCEESVEYSAQRAARLASLGDVSGPVRASE